MPTNRRFTVWLPRDDFRRLEELAAREERAAEQQASYLLRRALTGPAISGSWETADAAAA
jgi:hypothetical protein